MRPRLSDAVRELSKCMEESIMSWYKSLLLAINDLVDTKYFWWQIKLEVSLDGPWELRVYIEVDYVGYNDTQKIVTGYIVLINGSFIAWCSQSQKTVTFPVTEVEYLAIVELCFKILFSWAKFIAYGVFFYTSFVGEPQKITTRQANHDWYHGHGNGIYQLITDTMNIIPRRRCSP